MAQAYELGISPEYMFIEQASGKDFARPEYQLMKRMLRPGDLLYITSLDRLGRNKQMILDEWQELTKVKQVDIAVLDMPLLNTAKYKEMQGLETLISDLVLQLLSYMAEDERKRIKERQREGIAVARRKGIHLGRKKIDIDGRFQESYTDWKSGQITALFATEPVHKPAPLAAPLIDPCCSPSHRKNFSSPFAPFLCLCFTSSIALFQKVYKTFEIFQKQICDTFDTEKAAESVCCKRYTFCHTGEAQRQFSVCRDTWP